MQLADFALGERDNPGAAELHLLEERFENVLAWAALVGLRRRPTLESRVLEPEGRVVRNLGVYRRCSRHDITAGTA